MTVVWLRERDGTLLEEVVDWSFTQNPTIRRRLQPGQCKVSIRDSDDAYDFLFWDDAPDPSKPFHTWADMDLEVAIWPEGVVGVAPVGDPWWAGPVISCSATTGRVEVTAWTQEAYLERSPIGGEVTNYYVFSTFDVDPDLETWDDTYMEPGDSAETVDTGQLYLADERVLLLQGRLQAAALLPLSRMGNYATVAVPVYVPSGVSMPFDGLVAVVDLFTRPEGDFSFGGDPYDSWVIELPDGWEHDQWYLCSVQVGQPRGVEVLYKLTLASGDGVTRFGSPRLWRPENVSAVAGDDISKVAEAVLNQQADLLPGTWTVDVDDVGIGLTEPARYLSINHENSTDAVNDVSAFGEGWVEEMTLRWAPERGVYRGSMSLDVATLSGWRYEVDASAAATQVVAQVVLEDSQAYDEVWVGDGSVQRLVKVVQVPAGIGPSDSRKYAEAVLEASQPVGRLSGVPAFHEVPSAAGVSDWGVGDWMDVTLDLGGGRTIEVQPVVDGLEWDPVTHRVQPSEWVLGGQARQDPLEMMAAQMKAAERKRRLMAAVAPRKAIGRVISKEFSLSTSTPGQNESMALPAGVWSCWAVVVLTGSWSGTHYVNVYDSVDIQNSADGRVYASGPARAASVTIEGPAAGAAAFHRLDLTSGSVTSRTLTIYARRIA